MELMYLVAEKPMKDCRTLTKICVITSIKNKPIMAYKTRKIAIQFPPIIKCRRPGDLYFDIFGLGLYEYKVQKYLYA